MNYTKNLLPQAFSPRKTKKLLAVIPLCFLFSGSCFAQDTSRHKTTNIAWQYIRLNFDDDFLNIAGKGTDRYYTAGWQLDVCYTRNDNKTPFTDAILMKLPGASNLLYYGMSRRIYTPAKMDTPFVVPGDRPYASVLTIQHGLISTDPVSNAVLTTDVGLGAIGPVTLGGQIQKWFHRAIGDKVPQGWNTQVKNNVVIDYRVNYEKQVYSPMQSLKLLASIDCEAGTLVDNLGVGVTLALGQFSHTFVRDGLQILRKETNSRKLMFHVYLHPTVRTVMYNATLEGGMFSKTDPYVINKNDIDYIYFQYDMGLALVYHRIGLSFVQHTRTAEFRTGQIQQVGSFIITIPL